MDFGAELPFYLRAPYPYLYVVTWEEARLQRIVRQVCSQQSLAFETWSGSGEDSVNELFKRVLATTGPRVFLLCDFHVELQQPHVVRSLRNLSSRLIREKATLIISSPLRRIPLELDKELTLLELPLPSDTELRALTEAILREQQIDPKGLPLEALVRAARGLTEVEAYRAISKMLLMTKKGAAGDPVASIVDEKRQLLRRSRMLEFYDQPTTLDDVGGLNELKGWLRERDGAFGDEARRFGLPLPRGLLLVGVQGCGKSLCAKSIASLWRLPLVRFDVANLFNREYTPEESMRQVIQLAEAMSPIVLWIDEIDKAFQGRGSDSDAVLRVFGTFITWMQEKTRPVFVVATANAIDHLPPEMMRKGRFDEIFFVDLPDVHDRAEILAIQLVRHGRSAQSFDLMGLARATEHFSGAELEQLIVSGLFRAFQRKGQLEEADLRAASAEIVPLFFTYEESIKALREWARQRARAASRDTSLLDLFGSGKPNA
ncbi:MAG: AAA family ATPase [Myxococcales bacterium]|nr:AAA family ATPase [Myxococcales bacterium]